MDGSKKIAIIGAGFSGTAVAVTLSRITTQPLEIILFDKSGMVGAGDAYSTPYPWHILNVRARDMSAFDDESMHFADWVSARQSHYKEIDQTQPIGEQFLPRYIYHDYLQDLFNQSSAKKHVKLTFVAEEVVDAELQKNKIAITTKEKNQLQVDQVVLALGNQLPTQFPFAVSGVHTIVNPWDYTAIEKIPLDANILIAGMGLTMIDAVLTLQNRQHHGKIYAISRHGMLPLSHADSNVPFQATTNHATPTLRELTKQLRQKSLQHMQQGGDWRSIINALRGNIPAIWQQASLADKTKFIRHVLPYWNVHRHRVHKNLRKILDDLSQQKSLQAMAGRIVKVEDGNAHIRLRHQRDVKQFKIDWLINCMGPSLDVRYTTSPLIKALLNRGSVILDPLALGFLTTTVGELHDRQGGISNHFFTLGPPTRGTVWECTAVPEIRKQSNALAKILVGD